VTTVLEPRSTSRDVVGGALALGLDKDGGVDNVLAVPGREGLEELKSVRVGVHGDLDRGRVLGRGLEGVLSRVVALGGAPLSESVKGLKVRSPAKTRAVTRSGEVTKAWVAGLASLRPVKFRLYEERIELTSPFLTSLRSH
jgi:hypothetical protein